MSGARCGPKTNNQTKYDSKEEMGPHPSSHSCLALLAQPKMVLNGRRGPEQSHGISGLYPQTAHLRINPLSPPE